MDIRAIVEHFKNGDQRLIERAFMFASRAHEGQKRAAGTPYITHPIAVAYELVGLGFDAPSVAAAFLHDVLEDCGVTRAQLVAEFGEEVAALVDGVTKLKSISLRETSKDQKHMDAQTASLKKMFFAMADDLRVIIIKLADRLHNMRTLEYKERNARARKALETIEIYAPIADRLGMGRMRGELEDLAFPHAYPTEYAWLRKSIQGKYEDRLRYIERTAPIVKRHLLDVGVPVIDIHARAKRMWSLYRKLKRYDMDPDKVLDLVALRILVPDVKSCYESLGVIHAHYKPMPGRVKDFIALPKPNGYRSLHTTVFCEKGRIAEIQIRTPEMHDHAENGIAAHWAYSEQGKRRNTVAKAAELAWVNQLKATLKDIKSAAGMADVKLDFFKDRIFVLTPNGDVKDLPEGATPVDFAYAVHSELGHRTQGALVNGRLVPLAHKLVSGDVVEITAHKNDKPSKDWLRFVKTTQASKHIRSWFRRNDPAMAVADGRSLLNRELSRYNLSVEKLNRQQINAVLEALSLKTMDDLLTQLSLGDLDPALAVRHALRETDVPIARPTPGVRKVKPTGPAIAPLLVIAGQPGLAYKMGRCCSPEPGKAVVGYLTRSRGVTVHTQTCANIKAADVQRLMEVRWD